MTRNHRTSFIHSLRKVFLLKSKILSKIRKSFIDKDKFQNQQNFTKFNYTKFSIFKVYVKVPLSPILDNYRTFAKFAQLFSVSFSKKKKKTFNAKTFENRDII